MSESRVYSAEKAKVEVLIRLRPLPDNRAPDEVVKLMPDQPRLITVRNPDAGTQHDEHEFMFDRILSGPTSQDAVFRTVGKPLADHVLNGFNACCFAYGQTGSGKTYTMVGEGGEVRGLIPRTMEYLFDTVERRSPYKKVEMFVSFLELYLDQVRDLGDAYLRTADAQQVASVRAASAASNRSSRPNPLHSARPPSAGSSASSGTAPAAAQQPPPRPGTAQSHSSLQIREKTTGEIYVEDLSVIPVNNIDQIYRVIEAGFAKRQTYETLMNPVSSRSHTIFTLTIVQTDKRDETDVVRGKLNLVDLAGSERLARSHSEGIRLKEAAIINRSLSALGNVVIALDSGEGKHVPYRDSKLTRVLQDSLGGNSYTTLLATLNPSADNYEECLATLAFANRCRSIENLPTVNYVDENSTGGDARLKKLHLEVAELREELKKTHESYQKEIAHLKMAGPSGSSSEARGPAAAGSRAGAMETMFQNARRDQQFLMEKLERRKSDFRAVQDRVRNEHERHLRQQRDMSARILDMSNDVQVGKHDMVNAINEMMHQHADELNRVVMNNQMLLEQQSELLKNMPEVLRAKTSQSRYTLATLEQQHELIERDRMNERKARDRSLREEIEQLKDQYEMWLGEKRDRIAALEKELQSSERQRAIEATLFKKEISFLYEYLQRLTLIIENMESGAYNVWEQCGIRGFVVPAAHKPGTLNFDICRHLKSLVSKAEQFIESQEHGESLAPRPVSSSRASSRASALDRAAPSVPTLQTGDLYTMTVDDLRREVSRLRQQLESAQTRDLSETQREQIAAEMAAHPTVAYIQQLEDERAKYQQLLQQSRQREKQLQSALDSKDRLLQQERTQRGSTARSGTLRNGGMPLSAR